MVQNPAEWTRDVWSVNAEQGCYHAVLWLVRYSNKLVYLTSQRRALSCIQHLASLH